MEIIETIGAIFTSPGPGGVIVFFVISLAATVYFFLTRWIINAGQEKSDYDLFN